MTTLWTQSSAAAATGGKAAGNWQASRVEIDSRKVQAGDLFVAIKGDVFDGHDFVADALAKGAVCAVVSREVPGVAAEKLLVVKDPLVALEDLGKDARARSKAVFVGVTGSVGKTSTKEMLRLALSAHGLTYATSGNYNNHIGTPLNLANLPPETAFAVLEMGMNHAGEISHLTKMVRPNLAVITTVEAVHIEFFESIEGIADAKSEIFEGLVAPGAAILNADNPHFERMKAKAKASGAQLMLSFGESAQADARMTEYVTTGAGCRVSATICGQICEYTMGAVGRHWGVTSVLVLAVAKALGLDVKKTAEALAGYSELAGRGKVQAVTLAGGGEVLLIDDSYNASPASMRSAFAKAREVWLGQGKKGRLVAALGNMLELGDDAPQMHAGLAKDIVAQGFTHVYTAGQLMRHLRDALPPELQAGHAEQSMDVLALLKAQLKPGDVLLVKGSHGSKMYQLAAAIAGQALQKELAHAV